MRPIVNLPVVEELTQPPVAPIAGCCVVGDPTSVDQNLYFLFPGATADAVQFWRYDIAANTWQRRANPIAVAGTNVIGVATTMTYDVSRGIVWLFHADSNGGGPFAQLRSYTIATDTWALIIPGPGDTIQDAGLAAQFTVGAALAHPCTGIYPNAASDNFLYIVGNNGTVIFRYAIAANAFTALTGAVNPRGGNAAAGCTFDWLPGIDPNWLIGVRGGGSTAIDRYAITTDAWGDVAPTAYAAFSTGTSAVADIARNKLVLNPETGTGYWTGVELYDYAPALGSTAMVWKQLATLENGNGVPHNGRSVVALATAGKKWVYVCKHTRSVFQRVLLAE